MAAQPINPKTSQPYRPHHLPPPTEVPLRHCSHNEDSSPIDEVECLLSLLSPTPGMKKNKEHYTLATADPPAAKKTDKNDSAQQRKRKRDDEREEERATRRARTLRIGARSIPGVPIIYVKRSVMVLEPMSTPSESIRDGVEMGKFRAGLDDPTLDERKREAGADGAAPEKKKSGAKKVKGPNPLSVKKSKKRPEQPAGPAKTPKKDKSQRDGDGPQEGGAADSSEKPEGEETGAKTKRSRRHHKGPREGNDDVAPSAEAGQAMEVDT